jgi:hypothetical protein
MNPPSLKCGGNFLWNDEAKFQSNKTPSLSRLFQFRLFIAMSSPKRSENRISLASSHRPDRLSKSFAHFNPISISKHESKTE